MKVTELIARISADTSSFSPAVGVAVGDLGKLDAKAKETATSIDKIEQSGRNAGGGLQKLSSNFASITGAFGVSAGVAGLVQLATKATDAAAQMDGLQRGMTAVTGSATAAAAEIGRLQETAKLPGLGFEEAVQGSINLQAAGFSAKLSREALEGFGNALATVGKGKADLDGVILALSQIASKGKISAEEINQIAERVPQIRKIMQAAFGTADTEALQKMGISSQVFVERIVAELQKLPKATGGLKNDLENASDAWRKTLADMGKAVAPLVVATAGGMQKAAQGITDAVVIIQNKLDELKDSGNKWLRDAGPKWQLIASMLSLMNSGGLAVAAGKKLAGVEDLPAPGQPGQSPGPQSGNSGLKLGPTEDQIKKQREALERQIKGIYEAWDRYDKRLKEETEWRTKISEQMIKLDQEEWQAKTEWRIKTAEAIDQAKTKSLEIVPVTVSITDILRDAWKNTSRDSGEAIISQVEGVDRLRAAYRAFGLTVASDVEIELENLRKDLKVLEADVWNHAKGTVALAAAYEALAKAQDKVRNKEREIQGKGPIPEAKDEPKTKIDPAQARILREVSTIITDTSRNITDLIFKGGKFKDVMVSAAEEIGKALVRNVIQMGLEKIIGLIGKITSQIPGIGGALGKLGGIFGGGASSAAGGVASAAGGASSAAGGVASAAGSALSGWVTAGASVVSAISGIVFGIKAAKDADVANKHSLQLVMQGEATFKMQDAWFNTLHARMVEFRTYGMGVWPQPGYDWALSAAGGAGGGVTVNQNIYGNQIYGARGMEMLAQDLARLIKGYL